MKYRNLFAFLLFAAFPLDFSHAACIANCGGQALSPTASPTFSGLTVSNRLIVIPAKVLTDSLTPLFEVTLPTGSVAGGVIRWTIEADDTTDVQGYSGTTVYTAINKNGSYSTSIVQTASTDNQGIEAGTRIESQALSAGTLTTAWSITTGTNKITINCTPAGSLTETTYRIFMTIEQNSPNTVTVL